MTIRNCIMQTAEEVYTRLMSKIFSVPKKARSARVMAALGLEILWAVMSRLKVKNNKEYNSKPRVSQRQGQREPILKPGLEIANWLNLSAHSVLKCHGRTELEIKKKQWIANHFDNSPYFHEVMKLRSQWQFNKNFRQKWILWNETTTAATSETISLISKQTGSAVRKQHVIEGWMTGPQCNFCEIHKNTSTPSAK